MKKQIIILIFFFFLNAIEADSGNDTTDSDFTFVSNHPKNLISLCNATSSTATAWNPDSNLTLSFNGRNGSCVVYNHTNDFGVYIPGQASNLTWNHSREEWPNYQKNLSESDLYKEGKLHGTTFTTSNISEEILTEINHAVSSWSSRYRLEPRISNSEAFDSFKNISVEISDIFNGTLRNFLPIIDTRVIPISMDIFWVNEILRGMFGFFNNVRGGVQSLLEKKFELDPSFLFTARNGIEAFTYLIKSLESYYTLNDFLGRSLNCGENILKLVTQLGGNQCRGVTGETRMMFELLTYGNQDCGNTTIENFDNVDREWSESVAGLYNATRNLGSDFDGFRNFIDRMSRRRVGRRRMT